MKTTDPQDEIFPVVNEADEVIGKIRRKEAHKSPHIIHRAITVLVFDKEGKLLVQKRSLTKDTSPGCWAVSVGGHVGFGEEYLPVAIRETQEELGITVSPKNLQPLGKMITVAPWEKEMIKTQKWTASSIQVLDKFILSGKPRFFRQRRILLWRTNRG